MSELTRIEALERELADARRNAEEAIANARAAFVAELERAHAPVPPSDYDPEQRVRKLLCYRCARGDVPVEGGHVVRDGDWGGWNRCAYVDPKGLWHIGVGHRLFRAVDLVELLREAYAAGARAGAR